MQNFFIKSTALVIALLACHGCLVVPVPVSFPTPVISERTTSTTELEVGWEKTCYADALTQSQASEISESADSLEVAADKLAAAGKYKEAIRKYNEAGAAATNEAIADGTIEDMEFSAIIHNGDIEGFRGKNRPLLQKSAEFNFKVGSSYARLEQFEQAIDCFNSTLNIGILPPNDAIAHLNRGDAYERKGDKAKAKADFQQATTLFKKYKQPTYQKLSEQRWQSIK